METIPEDETFPRAYLNPVAVAARRMNKRKAEEKLQDSACSEKLKQVEASVSHLGSNSTVDFGLSKAKDRVEDARTALQQATKEHTEAADAVAASDYS